ncbi:hypothetical protein BDV97DRAFT_348269 [Delphinella strobiligena]|nr:hypothetical protein BDV97DRAFT_348269 [Delphinella strobiligena]
MTVRRLTVSAMQSNVLLAANAVLALIFNGQIKIASGVNSRVSDKVSPNLSIPRVPLAVARTDRVKDDVAEAIQRTLHGAFFSIEPW